MKHVAESLLFTIGAAVTLLAFLMVDSYMVDAYGQNIPGHGEVSRSLIITYVGPKDSVDFDMHWTRKTMRETPQIYCEGEFEVALIQELKGLDGDLEIVCTWDGTPSGSAGH